MVSADPFRWIYCGITAGILTILVLLLPSGAVNGAQPPSGKIYRVGLLLPSSPGVYSRRVEGFRDGLEKLGYVEGKNVVLEQRYAEGVSKQLQILALELVNRKVDVIVTSSSQAIMAISRASSTMPIVFTAIGPDPVEAGFISSFAKPGGNITGITIIAPDLDGKRLELLHEFSPKSQRIALLRRGGKLHDLVLNNLASPAKAVGLQLLPLRVKSADELEAAFENAKSNRAQALLVLPDPLFSTHQRRIVELAGKFRIPAIYHNGEFVEAGGLMSYGPDIVDNYRRAAVYVDKILKGAKPGELPVEQPTKFEFIINLKSAKKIGLTIPPNLLARADKVIR